MGVALGIFGQISFLTSGTRATWGAATNGIHSGVAPGLTPVPAVKSVTINMPDDEADVTTRAGAGFKQSAPALTVIDIDVEAPWQPTDTGLLAFLKAKLTKAIIPVAVLDGDSAVAGTQGLWADFNVFEWSIEQGDDDAQILKFKLKPGLSAVAPEWVKVTGA